MKNILITGFDPFGGEKINPAFEVIKRLEKKIGEANIHTLEVPTVFGKSVDTVQAEIDRLDPDFVICIGQAGGRFGITPERVAINIDDARIADNEGNQPLNRRIVEEGDTAYFSTLPVKAISRKIQSKGIPSAVSNTAGTFVCNHLMYGVLHHMAVTGKKGRAGFIHIPYLLQQVVDKPDKPGFSMDSLVTGIEGAIEACLENVSDLETDISGTLH